MFDDRLVLSQLVSGLACPRQHVERLLTAGTVSICGTGCLALVGGGGVGVLGRGGIRPGADFQRRSRDQASGRATDRLHCSVDLVEIQAD